MAIAQVPLILCLSQAGFDDRLSAVRHGAAAFIVKPFEREQMVESIGALEENDYERPSRVVIAEDDDPLSSFYQTTLEHAGMETRVIRRPSKLLDTLSGFDPNIIVMDLYMPMHGPRSCADRTAVSRLYDHPHSFPVDGIAARTQKPLSFAMIDIDHFKSVNDTYAMS